MPKIDITPSKRIYDALIQDISDDKAICDLIDNSIDNWKILKKTGLLEVNISISESKIEIKDNAGGIDLETLPLLLMPGGTNRTGGEGIKGIWGVGAKRALFFLGEKITILTRKKNEDGLKIDVDEDWFTKDEGRDKWEIEYNIDNSIPEEVTKIIIENLKIILNPFSIREIRKSITHTYRDEIKEETLRIIFNDKIIEIVPEIPWSKSDYAPPSRYITDIPVPPSDRKVHVEITLGVMAQAGEEYSYGIDFIGNGRIILQNNLDWRMGFKKERLGLAHPTINRFKAVVRVSGDSRDIPWNSAKSDIHPNHPIYVNIADLVFQVSRQYVSFLRKNYDVTSKLFRVRADETDIEEIIFNYGREFRKVVKEYREPKKEVTISFKVLEEDYNELVECFGLRGKPKKAVGLFVFNRALKEVRGIDED